MNCRYWIGIGFQKQAPKKLMEQAIQTALQSTHLDESTILGIATIEHKAKAAALIEICQAQSWYLRGFSAEVLNSITVPNPSGLVEAQVKTASVAEASALAACQPYTDQPNLLLPKTTFRSPDRLEAVTIAIAGYADVIVSAAADAS